MGKGDGMAETVRLVEYYSMEVSHKAGAAQEILGRLAEAGVYLLTFSGFPQGRRAQLDFVPVNGTAFRTVARKAGWKVAGAKKAFLIYGEDRVGVVAELLEALTQAKINVTATQAIIAGADRFGMILWVKPGDVRRAAKALQAS
jgi:hypothetical protein